MKNLYQLFVKFNLPTRQTILKMAEKCNNSLSLALLFLLCSIPFLTAVAEPDIKNNFLCESAQKASLLIDKPLAVSLLKQEESNFISLFNGKDLTGWCYKSKVSDSIVTVPFEGTTESSDSRYTAKEGQLTINPWDETKGPHWVNLWTVKEFTGDFILTLEFRASPNADSGIFLRGKQLQCRDYLVAGPYKELKNYKPQDWNKIEVVVKNNIAHCTCNGEILEDALQVPATGSIGLEADRGRMDYRNILIKVL